MMYENFKLLTVERMIRSLIGISKEQFATLAVYFAAAYDAIQLERLQNGEIKCLPSLRAMESEARASSPR